MSDDVKMVCIGGQRVGIIGLQRVLEEIRAQDLKSHLDGCNDPAAAFSKNS
jgi:hypothetical protein